MPTNFNPSALLGLFQAKSPMDYLHVLLEAVGGAVVIWGTLAQLLPRAAALLTPYALRAADAVALFLLANPYTGPLVRAHKDRLLPLLHQLRDLAVGLIDAFDNELEKDIEAPDAPPATPTPPTAAPGGASNGSATPAPAAPPASAPSTPSPAAAPPAAPGV